MCTYTCIQSVSWSFGVLCVCHVCARVCMCVNACSILLSCPMWSVWHVSYTIDNDDPMFPISNICQQTSQYVHIYYHYYLLVLIFKNIPKHFFYGCYTSCDTLVRPSFPLRSPLSTISNSNLLFPSFDHDQSIVPFPDLIFHFVDFFHSIIIIQFN